MKDTRQLLQIAQIKSLMNKDQFTLAEGFFFFDAKIILKHTFFTFSLLLNHVNLASFVHLL